MPLYEYACPQCKERFEARKDVKNYQQPATCPECGAEAPRVFSKPAIHTADMWVS